MSDEPIDADPTPEELARDDREPSTESPPDASSDVLDAALALIAEAEVALSDVERSLARLEAGTYGSCEVCGQPIEPDLLADQPAGRRCRAHRPGAG